MAYTAGGGACYYVVRSGTNTACPIECGQDMANMWSNNGGNGMPNPTMSLYFQCFANSASTQNMNGITFSIDGVTLDPAIMSIANYKSTTNCSSQFSCPAIASTLAANNLLSAVVNTYSNTELQSEPVICGYGYTWGDGSSNTTPKSAVCSYPGFWILPAVSCVCMLNTLVYLV